MTASTTSFPTKNAHQEIQELLPWYANDTLIPAEKCAVEQHLEQCSICRKELEQCRIFSYQTHTLTGAAWQPPAGHFDRLMADIDRLTPPATPAKASPPLAQRILDWLRITPSPVRWTLAVESLAVAALVLMLVVTPATPPDLGYETLSNGKAPMAAANPRLRVVFAEPMTVGALGALLRDIGGQIVAGPTALGVYTVAVAGGEQPIAAQNQAVATLRAHEQVRLAEPLESHRRNP